MPCLSAMVPQVRPWSFDHLITCHLTGSSREPYRTVSELRRKTTFAIPKAERREKESCLHAEAH